MLDTGHFYPTEMVSYKISPILQFAKGLLLYVSRPMRGDLDHVVSFSDEPRAIMQKLVREQTFSKTTVALGYFDGSINRVMAVTIGAINTRKHFWKHILQPVDYFKGIENISVWQRMGLLLL